MSDFAPNMRVVLHVAPAKWATWQGAEGIVKKCLPGYPQMADVCFDTEGGTVTLTDVPCAYLRPVVGASVTSSRHNGVVAGATTSRMNKTEERYFDEVLSPLLKAGHIAAAHFEGLTLRLGDDCRFTPDFFVILPGGLIELREVKAAGSNGKPRIEDDALVKLKTCRTIYPLLPLRVVWPANKTFPPIWNEMEIKP